MIIDIIVAVIIVAAIYHMITDFIERYNNE